MERIANAFRVRRKLHIHSAHTTIGVGGAAVAFRPYFRHADSATDDVRVQAMRVLLVDRGADTDSRAALALLEQSLCQRYNVRIANVAFSDIDADCVIVLGGGLRVAGRWSDLDASTIAPSGFEANDARPMEVEPIAGVCGHPVLDGIRPFVSCGGVGPCVGVANDANCLLMGKVGGVERPVAWAWHGQRGRVFRTALGHSDDFRQPDFVRLVLNAVDWVGRQGQRQ